MILAAAMACAPRGSGIIEQSCVECEADPALRVKWGCDAPAAQPVLFLDPCPHCDGGHPSCTHCGGEGRAPIYRCPMILVTQRELDAVSAASLIEHGVLPEPGGWQDQPSTWVQVVPLLLREIAHWREVAYKQRQKQQQKRR